MAKKVEKKVEKIPYLLGNVLGEKIALLKVPTYGDLERFKAIQEILSEVSQELQGKIQEIFKNNNIESEISKEDPIFDKVNSEYQEVLKSDSSVNKSKLQVFTKDQFELVFNGSNLNVSDALTLEHWLVK